MYNIKHTFWVEEAVEGSILFCSLMLGEHGERLTATEMTCIYTHVYTHICLYLYLKLATGLARLRTLGRLRGLTCFLFLSEGGLANSLLRNRFEIDAN